MHLAEIILMKNIVMCTTFPEENSNLQSRRFRAFRNSVHFHSMWNNCKMLPMKIQEKL